MAETRKKCSRKLSAVEAANKKEARRSEEGRKSKKESDRRRGQTRITIGIAFPRWRALKEKKGIRSDTDVALLLLDSYEKRSSILMISTGTCMREPTALSCLGHVLASERVNQWQQDEAEYLSETTRTASEVDGLQDSFDEMEVTIDDDDCSVKNRLSDLDSDLENAAETAELNAPAADDSWDEDTYVPLIPQRSKTSELLLECEEEELAPWQQHTLCVHVKEEEDVGELTDDQTDCQPDPSSLQSWSAAQLSVTPEVYGGVHTSEGHQISSDLMSLSSVQSPAVCAASPDQLPSDQSLSQTLSAPVSLPCVTVINPESTSTSNQQ